MNKKKWLVCVLALVMAVSFGFGAGAIDSVSPASATVDTNSARLSYIWTVSSDVVFDGSRVSAIGSASAQRAGFKLVVRTTLEGNSGGGWYDLYSGSNQTTSDDVIMVNFYYAKTAGMQYRTRTTATMYTLAGTELETVTIYSKTIQA